jgi:hypothetical protein
LREALEMNGFADHGLDEDAFGEKKGSIVQAFDAFRKFNFLIYLHYPYLQFIGLFESSTRSSF